MAKILIADDDADILELVDYNLSKEGHEVHRAENGKIALEKANELEPDMVILDIMMPEYDGVAVCEILRSKKKFKDTLIVFLTARMEDFTQISCYENGGDDYIVKPVRPRVFLSRVNAMLRRRDLVNDSNKNEIKVGNIRVDMEQYKVYKGDVDFSFAKKEFELLTLLASRPGKLFSREEIFNKVWGVDTVISDRTIDVHIRKIREKLGNEYIRTIKGIGYKFETI